MKKLLHSFLLATVVLASMTISRPSQATVGLLTANPHLLIGGLAVSLTGLVGGAHLEETGMFNGLSKTGQAALKVNYALGFIGLLMLDGEQTLSFSELSQEEASKLGISASELSSYNSQIDEVNALVSHVDAELSLISKPTLQDSQVLWSSVKEAVAPETFEVMQKISSQTL